MADQQDGEELHFSHFPSHGFRLEDQDFLSQLVNQDWKNPVDGIVFGIPPESNIHEVIAEAHKLSTELNLEAVAHVQLPRKSEGEMLQDDREVSNRVAEALVAAYENRKVSMFLDTFIDHDRGYYPRKGILDRRGNPNPGYYVLKSPRKPECAG
jgi:hypothetical protein